MLTGLLPLAALTGLGGILSTSIAGIGKAFTTGLSTLGTTLSSAFSKINPFSKKPTTTRTKPSVAGSGQDEKKLKESAKKQSNLVKSNKVKGQGIAKKFAKGAARVGGRVFLPLAAALSIFDAATGVAQADELLDKDEGDLTFRDKASAGFAGFLSGLTFGLADKEKLAKKFAGVKDTTETNLTSNEKNLFGGYSNTMSQGDTLNKEMATSTTTLPGTTIINNNNVAAPVNNTNVAKSESILPHMANKNTDKTVIEIQDIF